MPPTSSTTDSLSALDVIDRLIVGPVKLEPRRLTAAYTVVRNGTENRTDLIYSYEEKVFDPEEPESWESGELGGCPSGLELRSLLPLHRFSGHL